MIDLSQSSSASPQVHTVAADPGTLWVKDAKVAIDAPPDSDVDPLPEAQWTQSTSPTGGSLDHADQTEPLRSGVRSGLCGVVSPRVLTLPGGGYRMYYSQILPRAGFPAGANDYDNSTTRILSAVSEDGSSWRPEPGVRLSSQVGGAGEFRVVSSEVVPVADGSRLRMYYECCLGPQSEPSTIRSAVSLDGGLVWSLEPGTRLEASGHNYSSPRILFLSDGRCRLYCLDRGHGIISALSEDGGRTFHREPGLRIDQNGTYDSLVAFAPEILRVADAGYVMYYAGYSVPNRSYILRAVSDDGLTWRKEVAPVLSPGNGVWDGAKCSEMCLFRLPHQEGHAPRYRMVYEACDGTAKDQRGVWRIASAVPSTR